MMLRIAVLSVVLLVLSLISLPATASQPEGLAGEIISGAVPAFPGFCFGGFEWLAGGYEMPLAPSDTLTLELAIVPFPSGITAIGIDFGPFYTTAVPFAFQDGLVAGIPYDRNGWNDVVVQVDLGRREFGMTVNGRQAGPFPFQSDCGGACTTVANFRINGSDNSPGAAAWVDSIHLVRHGSEGDESYYDFTADPCLGYPYVSGGGLVFLEAPRKFRPTR